MGKRVFGILLAVLLVCCAGSMAEASVFIDFDTAPLTPDTSGGAHTHTLSTAYGDITFDGRIWDYLDYAPFADNTSGSGYFLKNTDAQSKVTMTFSFDVASVDFYWAGISGATLNGEVYDASGTRLDGGSDPADGTWMHVFASPGTPIRSLSFWGGKNKLAIDDMTIEVVPEPASMVLMGIGLAGAFARRRKIS